MEQLDVNNKYNPVTSTFNPRENGVYSNISSNSFNVLIPVNGNEVASNREDADFSTEITASTIIPLEAGNTIEVFAFNTSNGRILYVP